jgi:hypothetical protein
MAIGWPNASYQQSGPIPLTASIASSNDLILEGDYTLRWWGGAIEQGNGSPQTFFTCGENGTIHSAYLTYSAPNMIFKYGIGGTEIISVAVPGVLSQRWNFYCVQRVGNKIYFVFNGQWVANQVFNTNPVSNQGEPLYIGSNNSGRVLQGEMTNFEWINIATYATNVNFDNPIENFTPNGNTIFLVGQGLSLNALKGDLSGNGNNVTTGPSCSYELDDPWGDGSTGSFLFQ